MDNLTPKGLVYEEDGEKKLIPRANIQDGYMYTLEENEKKRTFNVFMYSKISTAR